MLEPEPIFIFDLATCTNYFIWNLGVEEKEEERKNLYDLFLKSAVSKADKKYPLIAIPDNIVEKLVTSFSDRPLGVDAFLEATDIISSPVFRELNIEDSLIKLAALYTFLKKPIYLVVSDIQIYDTLKQANNGLKVLNLKDVGKILSSAS